MPDRLERARVEIARRRASAEAAIPGPWTVGEDGEVTTVARYGNPPYDEAHRVTCDGEGILPSVQPAEATYIAENHPAHVLAVLDAAVAALDRHAACTHQQCVSDRACVLCWKPWPCADALAVLDIYAPVESRS